MLDLRDLDVDYGRAPALWRVSLQISAGELVSIVGPNGAGKTTLINAIAGLHLASGGRIVMDGIDLTRFPAHRFCGAGIAIVPEGRRLFTRMTVRENLEIGAYAPAARSGRAGALERVCALFPAVRDKLAAPAGALSGGQQQMVAIGRALMAQPRLLLLDEPSLGLSPLMVKTMFGAIRDVNAGGTSVLLVEQNVAMALDVADRAYLLEEGRIVSEGTPDEVFGNPALRRAYLGAATAD
ncbi:MAG TPA: ABC transporter ATP-binding protein [Casimicrobiaceae bacterium]|nr:ABC transporter ATP-binding protein [Casimicrobiaceae bacterium]